MSEKPDVWLRGPVEGIPPLLQPIAMNLMQVLEDVDESCRDLTTEQAWTRPSGIAPIGYHLRHLAGSIERLFTYARGDLLTTEQVAAMKSEGSEPADTLPELKELLQRLHDSVERALNQLHSTPERILTERREVGRSKLPSTVFGVLFHAAEHAFRHAGQITSTAKIVR